MKPRWENAQGTTTQTESNMPRPYPRDLMNLFRSAPDRLAIARQNPDAACRGSVRVAPTPTQAADIISPELRAREEYSREIDPWGRAKPNRQKPTFNSSEQWGSRRGRRRLLTLANKKCTTVHQKHA